MKLSPGTAVRTLLRLPLAAANYELRQVAFTGVSLMRIHRPWLNSNVAVSSGGGVRWGGVPGGELRVASSARLTLALDAGTRAGREYVYGLVLWR